MRHVRPEVLVSEPNGRSRLTTPTSRVPRAPPRQQTNPRNRTQQEHGIDEAFTCESGLVKGEHEARTRVAGSHALVAELIHCEGGDAHLRILKFRVISHHIVGNGDEKEAENVYVAGPCEKAEDAVVLLIKRPHVRRVRPSVLARASPGRD